MPPRGREEDDTSPLDLNRLLPPSLLKAPTCYRCYNRDKCDKCDKKEAPFSRGLSLFNPPVIASIRVRERSEPALREMVFQRIARGSTARIDTQLPVDRLNVSIDCVPAQDEALRDLVVAHPHRQQLQHLTFPCRERFIHEGGRRWYQFHRGERGMLRAAGRARVRFLPLPHLDLRELPELSSLPGIPGAFFGLCSCCVTVVAITSKGVQTSQRILRALCVFQGGVELQAVFQQPRCLHGVMLPVGQPPGRIKRLRAYRE